MSSNPPPLFTAREVMTFRFELQQVLDKLKRVPMTTPCAECTHYLHDSSQCSRHRSVVPDEYRAAGCAQFELSEIPF